jgi:hypothetical protein
VAGLVVVHLAPVAELVVVLAEEGLVVVGDLDNKIPKFLIFSLFLVQSPFLRVMAEQRR